VHAISLQYVENLFKVILIGNIVSCSKDKIIAVNGKSIVGSILSKEKKMVEAYVFADKMLYFVQRFFFLRFVE
jgi:hypothetical protein